MHPGKHKVASRERHELTSFGVTSCREMIPMYMYSIKCFFLSREVQPKLVTKFSSMP